MAEQTTNKRKVDRIKKTDKDLVITLPAVKAPGWLQGFVDFIREQGVVGLAVGLILGVASKSVIDSLVNNIFNPVIGLISGGESLDNKVLCVKKAGETCETAIAYGQFLSDVISFVIVAAVVYFVIKGLKLDKLDKKKE
jgi:large conductance mechanosensitive channel